MLAACLFWTCAVLSLHATSIHTWAEHSALAQGTWLKIALNSNEDGIYQIPYSQLRSWGFSNPSQVGVYGFGGHVLNESFKQNHIDDLPEVAIYHDQAGQRILFYGRGTIAWDYKNASTGFVQTQHPYSQHAYYFLHQKDQEAVRSIQPQASSSQAAQIEVSEYDDYWLHEQETANLGKTGRMWVGESFLTTQSQTFTLPDNSFHAGHMIKAGTGRLDISFVAKANETTSYTVQLNDTTNLGTQNIYATTSSYGFGMEGIMSKVLSSQADMTSMKIRITYSPKGTSPTAARLNYIRLQGKCPLEAISYRPYTLFRHAASIQQRVAYHIRNIEAKMQVWDVTSPVDICQQMLEGDSLFVADQLGLREYAIVNTNSRDFPQVSRVGIVRNMDLHATPAVNLVILAPSGLLSEAKTLADYRLEHDQLSYCLLTPEGIYNEYSSGVPDATAIRLFLKNLYDKEVDAEGNHTLRYLLLFGDGHYDNRRAATSNNHLITYESQPSLVETSSYVSDDYFGFMDDSEGGNVDGLGQITLSGDRLDIGIGRIPVSSSDDAMNVVNKIIGYDHEQYGSWKNQLCFLSDDDKIESGATDSPNLHMRHNDQLVNALQRKGHHEFIYQKIYLPAYQHTTSASGTDYPDARKELNNVLQQGTLILNYAGHGSTNSITHEQIMSATLARNLRSKHLPVWITASCDVSRWDADDKSMGENLLLNPQGGAAALISTTRVVYASQNLSLNKAIIDNLFDRNSDGTRYRMGDILRAAKVQLGSDYNKLNFCLLGDPTMTLAFPEQEIKIDSIQGTFQALNYVTIYGHVNRTGTQELDTTFEGLIYPTIYDAEDTIAANKGLYQLDEKDEYYRFVVRKRKLFAGRDIIRQGKFQFSFIVPNDVSPHEGNGMINLYACSVNGQEGNGYYSGFAVRHGSNDAQADTIGPDILACFLDDPSFQSGDVVGRTPFFFAEVTDPSGINATGNSIGHDLSLTLQCISNPLIASRQIVLNNYFTTYTSASNYGNVKCSLTDLNEGTYQATFRVWDAYNNVSSYTFTFTVSDRTKPTIQMLSAYPSPVKQGEMVTFQLLHNRPESADQLRLQIYTQTGIKVTDQVISSTACEAVYLRPDATSVTQISHALNADETSEVMGSTSITWNANVAPGVYLYKVYLSASGDDVTTQAKMLIVY